MLATHRRVLLFSLLASLLACHHATTDRTLLGQWKTDTVMSQLGPSVTAFTFREDGTFTVSTRFKTPVPAITASGQYRIEGNRLVMFLPETESAATFSFESDDVLIIDEEASADRFYLKRQ
jgi:hypothetical protein